MRFEKFVAMHNPNNNDLFEVGKTFQKKRLASTTKFSPLFTMAHFQDENTLQATKSKNHSESNTSF